MAGGQNGRSVDSVQAVERVTRFAAVQNARRTPRHCWVVGLDDAPERIPALLIAWDNGVGTWSGRVVYCVDEPEGPMIVHRWLSSEYLRAAE